MILARVPVIAARPVLRVVPTTLRIIHGPCGLLAGIETLRPGLSYDPATDSQMGTSPYSGADTRAVVQPRI